jgi:transcriptional regulator with XRE-family HTH domain
MAQKGLSPEALAAACNVDPKTVDRWVAKGRVPHRKHRWTAAQRLNVEESYLWPPETNDAHRLAATQAELIGVFPNRASVPQASWVQLLTSARQQIDVLVFSGTFFAQSNPHVARMLAERADAGVQVRLCFGDPSGRAVAIRDEEEGIAGTLSAKIRASLTYYRKLVGTPGCEVRLHDTTLYNSLFRYDDVLMVNPHIWGQPASANPLLQLRRLEETGWFDHYSGSFDAVWETAKPWSPEAM